MATKKRHTYADVHLGRIYFDILLEHARHAPGEAIRYGEMVELAKARYPNDDTVQNAIPTSIGRRLDVVVEFCQINTLPDLACLGINQTGKPGERYELDNGVVWREEMDRVAAFDWNAWTGHWHTFAIAASKAAIKLGRVKESVASEMRYRYWNINRTKYPSYTPEQAGAVLELIMEGHSVEEAFDDVLGKSQHAI